MGPLLPDPGARGPRLRRRVRGIGTELVAFALISVASPLLLAVAAAVDLVRGLVTGRPWVGVRLVAMAWLFLLGELRGLAGLALAWLRSGGRDTATRRRRVYALRRRWAGGHLDAVTRLFRLRWEIEGLDEVAPGPVLVLMRHASIIDNAMPDAVIGRTHGIGLRFVLKREMQALPTADIGGRWVPTSFVRRASGDTEGELVDLRRLAEDLWPDEGVLIYPEGTRHTPEKLRSAQEKIRERQPEVAPFADRLRSVLPPRLGGPLALLEAGRGTDVVFCGHVGFDGFETVGDIWSGRLVGQVIRVRFWRHPAAAVPEGREALTAWLYEQWLTLDDWVSAESRAAGPGPGGSRPAP